MNQKKAWVQSFACFLVQSAWLQYSESPTHELSSCELSKVQMDIWFQQGARTCAFNIRHE